MAQGSGTRSEKTPEAPTRRSQVLYCVVCGRPVHLTLALGHGESDGRFVRVFDQGYAVHVSCLKRFWQEFKDEDLDLPHITMTTYGVRHSS